MPEPRRRRRIVLALAAGALAATVAAAPAALAQGPDPDDWSGSSFAAPFRGGFATVQTESFAIAGTFRKDARPLEEIVQVQVHVETADGTTSDPCLPIGPTLFTREGRVEDGVAVYDFEIPAEESVWPCNGRYRVVAEAQSNQELAPFQLVGELSVAVPPADVDAVDARYDAGADQVTVTWAPLRDPAVDAVGYRVERAGPGDGPFTEVAEVGPDGQRAVDAPPGGDYRYRVRAIRSGPDGPVLSSGGPAAAVTVPGAAPDTTTTTRPAGTHRPRANRGVVPGRVTPRLSPPTTVDTGFEETLDYGPRDAPAVEPGDQQALAGAEGQSIIRTEDDSPGLLAPAAGALVLLGWAGHVAYLNRLAKQF